MKWGFLFLFSLFLFPAVFAFEIVCIDGDRGVKVWNYNQTFNETGWTLEDIENEEGLNCTVFETNMTELRDCDKYYGPVINILNRNIMDKNKIIARQNLYIYFAWVFMGISVILLIILKLNLKERKDARRKAEKR